MKYGKTLTALSLSLTVLAYNSLSIQAYAAGESMQLSTGETQKSADELFLEKNKDKPGVITLPDGLQYQILTEGKGESPKDSDTVIVDYSGTLIDGTEFDSSYKRGRPAVFPVNAVIPGWTEALKLMKVGSTWNLYIPASLAYGAQGAPPAVGPNQTLIFKVHLISINHDGFN